MPVIGHDAKCQQRHGMLPLGFAEDLLEGRKVHWLIEKRPTRIGSGQNVINHAARRRSQGSPHAAKLPWHRLRIKEKRCLTPFPPFLKGYTSTSRKLLSRQRQ